MSWDAVWIPARSVLGGARRRALPLLVCTILVPAAARADELPVIGEHASSGQKDGRAYTGTLTVRADATVVEVRGADGERRAGTVRVVGRGLELTLAGEEPRRFERDDTERAIRWRWQGSEDTFQVIDMGPKRSRTDTLARLLRRSEGVKRWLLEGNLGDVDPDPQRRILRCRQPQAKDVVRYQEEYGIKTIISLNGEQDDEVRVPTPDGGERRTTLHAFILERGIRHETFGLSASRAPSDAELTAIFRLLRDDSLKPILIHCRGGSDRTGVVSALYAIEYLGQSKEAAKATMRQHMWAADGGTEIQGAVVDLYQPGHLRRLLGETARRWF